MRRVPIFLGWASFVFGASCVDDPSFNIGYGDCSTYAVGGRNKDYCGSDGAVVHCLKSCGSCGGTPGGSTGTGIAQNGQCMMVGSTVTCATGLTCKAGSSSSMYGTCQPAQSALPTCGVFEILTQCGTACEQKCSGSSSSSSGSTGTSPCACASGYARYNGQCILQSQCPQQGQKAPPVQQATAAAQFSPNVNGVVGTKTCSTHQMCGTQNYCFACAKCFLKVGYDNAKTLCGACYANPMAPQPSNCGPIASCTTRMDAIDGLCPSWGNAPSCGNNEVYMTCASQCEPVCGQPDSTTCNKACAPGGGKCQCIAGYRRQGNQCVMPYECSSPPPACGTNEVFLQCSSLCEQTCGKSGGACPAVCGPPRCQCASGYTRMNSQCVLPYQCPSVPVSQPDPTCGQNEVFATCSNVCEPKCGVAATSCTTACGTPKCQCAPGMMRSAAICVPPSQCPQQGGPGGGSHSACDENEEFKQCASYCEPQCGQPVPTTCNKACAPSACQCMNGYQRQGSNCVPSSQCPTFCPPDTCTLYCSGGRVKDSNGCSLCQCQTSPQTDPCNPSPCAVTQACVPTTTGLKYQCVAKTGGKPQGANCVSSTECQAIHICYKGPFATTGLCLPASG